MYIFKMYIKKTVFISVLLAVSLQVYADVKLPAIISDNMVLQQKAKAPIWGWADANETVEVKGSWQWVGISTQADQNGKWQVNIKTPLAGGPHELVIKGKNTIVLNNVLSGEVWLCSGQSNMKFPVSRSLNAETQIPAADYPNIRLFTVKQAAAQTPQQNCQGSWKPCTPQTVKNFSAVGYYFGKELHTELKVPVALIGSYWGGTPAETWTKIDALKSDSHLKTILDYNPSRKQKRPGRLYNAMISPLIPFAIKGAVWFQGEANVARAYQYRKLFPAMINSWRDEWDQGLFPFYYVQLTPFEYEKKNDGRGPETAAELREAQLMTLSLPNTGMAVTMDIGNPNDIHAKNKIDVGRRLSLWALANDYEKDIVYSGPIYKSMKIEGDKIRLMFDHVGSGLMAKGLLLKEFTMAGPDKKFYPAAAVIDQDTVLVSCAQVDNPLAVRYAWSNTAIGNLYNKESLPASPFRTDDWPGVTKGR